MIEPIKKVVAYIRVSTDDQDLSTEVQHQKIYSFCQFLNVFPVKIFADSDVSGRKPLKERPEGGKMLEYLSENPDVVGVIGLRVDRVFRNDVDGLTTVDEWSSKGISLYTTDVAGNIVNTQSSTGRLLFTLMLSFAVFESARISERTSDAMAQLKRSRKKYSKDPYGFVSDADGNLVRHEGEIKIIKEIISMSLNGRGQGYIATELSRRGIPSKRNKTWYGSTVKNILSNSLYSEVRSEVFAERKINILNKLPARQLELKPDANEVD
jgi:DNA invertase Pin-like site-specific DNA recombinase